jgi:DNA repair protein RecN (Recombination protein N)
MLSELHIENFALIDKLTITLAPSLNILTGETGAGKSIILDAITVLLGERAGTDLIRTGAARALVHAVFDLTTAPHILPVLAEIGVEPEEGVLVLTREVAREGRSLARVNGRTTPVSVLRHLGDLLVDLHGQHEHQSLLREDTHLAFLDALGDEAFATTKTRVLHLAHERQRLRQEVQRLTTDERERLRTLDLLSYQVQEIDRAQLVAGEEEELLTERTRLAHAEKLHAAASSAYTLLYDGDDHPAVLDTLGAVQSQLEALVRFDPALEPLVGVLEAAAVQINDTCHELAAYREHTLFDPERLNLLEERLELMAALKRKYGETIPDILAHGARQRDELTRLTHHEERRAELLADLARTDTALALAARELSAHRRRLAEHLAADVQTELTHLGMPKARFLVDLARQPHPDGLDVDGARVAVFLHGIDVVAFHFSANVGEPPRRLAKIASGGELSRVMLALKAIAARGTGVPTLIFDEIDSGIGGRTAEAVGAKLAQVARGAQVLCVTHLAQLAYYADKHFLVEKATDGERTVTSLRELPPEERVEELARLQAGTRVSGAVRDHIRTVLDDIHGTEPGRLG